MKHLFVVFFIFERTVVDSAIQGLSLILQNQCLVINVINVIRATEAKIIR